MDASGNAGHRDTAGNEGEWARLIMDGLSLITVTTMTCKMFSDLLPNTKCQEKSLSMSLQSPKPLT